jgi:predicted  nucleic acid-binding Zn-ribbon protein
MEKRGRRLESERIRAHLAALRTASSECVAELSRADAAFRDYRARVDSLRGRIRRYEAMDSRGVPDAQYDAYLDAFEEYNDSVSAWQERADSLEARTESCQEIARRHNALADSARRRMEELARREP